MSERIICLLMARILAIILVVSLMFVGTAIGEISRNGLVAEWHFDGDAKDSSGNGNDGTILGAIFTDGKFGKALSFNGVDNYVNVGNAASLNPTAITIESWVKPIDTSHYGNIVSKDENFGYRFRIDPDKIVDFLDRGATNIVNSSPYNVPLNQWSHIAVVGDSNGLKIYINGNLNGINNITYGGSVTPGSLKIGAEIGRLGNWDEYFNGLIDEIRIYNRALSAEEIKANYEAGQIIITSSVSGAQVLLDGISKGTASPTLTISGISPGSHTVTCRLSSYSDNETTVNLDISATVSSTCSLSQLPGSISVTSSPSGVDVYLDGTLKGTAPVILKDVPIGTRVIWCKKSGYEDLQQSIEVTAGNVTTVTCTLTPISTVTSIATSTVTPTTLPPTAVPTTIPTTIPSPSTSVPSITATPITPKLASITGKVLDAKTGEPVPDVTITIGDKSTTTGLDGRYELKINTGDYSNLTAIRSGYETITKSANVPDAGIIVDFAIIPSQSGSSWLWVAVVLLIVVISAGLIYLIYRKKNLTKEETVIDPKDDEKKVEEIKEEKKRFCIHCNAPVPLDAEFCPKCGKKQEIKRFCMNCGSSMPPVPDLCPECSKLPPSGVDTKECRNCKAVLPLSAKFCDKCGAAQ